MELTGTTPSTNPSIEVRTQRTPNPNAWKFILNRDVKGEGKVSYTDEAQCEHVPLAVALLSAAGLWSAMQLPSAIYPELTFPRITIVAEGSSLGARQVVFAMTRPIEEAVSIVPGVERVKSRSIRGSSEVSITFNEHTDMPYALQLVRTRVEEIRGEFIAIDRALEMLRPGDQCLVLVDQVQEALAHLSARVNAG